MNDKRPMEAPILTGDTRLSVVLDAVPCALEYIVSLRPHDFERLHHPFMRKYMPPRISLARVAAMAGIPAEKLLRDLRVLAGQDALGEVVCPTTASLPQSPCDPPPWMRGIEWKSLRCVDVLPIDNALGDPFPPISVAVKRMQPGEVIVLLHRWEPQPLYDIWQKMGIEWFSERVKGDEWHVFLFKPPTHPVPSPAPSIAIELRYLSEAEAAPRVVAMFEQLQGGQSLEITGASPCVEEQVRAAMEKQHGGAHEWQSEAAAPDKTLIRITAQKRSDL